MKFEDMLLIALFSACVSFIILSFILLFAPIPSNILYKNFRDNDKVFDLVIESAKFYHNELGIERDPKIVIHTKWSPKFFFDVQGYMAKKPDKDGYDVVIYKNHNIYSILETVAHEMIHVKQYNRGDLANCGVRKLWKGKDHTKTKYWKRPWEKEAFAKEKALAKKFFDKKGMKKPIVLR